MQRSDVIYFLLRWSFVAAVAAQISGENRSNVQPSSLLKFDYVSSLAANVTSLLVDTNQSSTNATTTISITNTSLAASDLMTCTSDLGTDLDSISCRLSFRAMDYSSSRNRTWGPRGTGVRYDLPMPQRWVGCKLLRFIRSLCDFLLIVTCS